MAEEMFDPDKGLGDWPQVHSHQDADNGHHAQKLNQRQGVFSMLPG